MHIRVAIPVALLLAGAAYAQNPAVTVAIDANSNRHAISPLIYGVAFASQADLTALNAPLNRSGGNNMSTYSYANNAQNLDADWYFESYPQGSTVPGAEADSFVALTQAAGAQPMLTVPMIGWVAKLGPNQSILPSFSVAKYGAQCGTDPYDSDAGDGLETDCSTPITGNNPNDAYIPDSAAKEQTWIRHLIKTWGKAAAGGVPYYLMDNEPSIWFSTHRDIHPVGPHADEYRKKVLALSAKIKAHDTSAQIVGPEEWGWDGYFYSGYDQQYTSIHGYSYYPDRTREEDGMDYIPWLLTQWKAAHAVDVVSVHFYPQGGEYSDDNSTATQLLRNRSTRQLWDPNYVSESWIDAPVYLIPRMQGWVSTDYIAGTPVAITEYNWGDEANINGATAQADIYGIFGQQGLNMATRWTVPANTTPTYKAMQMYRNYDGANSTFGDTSVAATVPNPDDLSAFAARRTADGALTVMVISKVLSGTTPVTLSIANFAAGGSAQRWQLTSANTIQSLGNVTWSGGNLSDTVPAQSVTLYVLPQ
jgi:Glycoside hydrolase family 44